MTTIAKKRINVTLSDDNINFLSQIAKAEKKPTATKAREFLEMAMELHEDYALSKWADKRERGGGRLVKNSEELWK